MVLAFTFVLATISSSPLVTRWPKSTSSFLIDSPCARTTSCSALNVNLTISWRQKTVCMELFHEVHTEADLPVYFSTH